MVAQLLLRCVCKGHYRPPQSFASAVHSCPCRAAPPLPMRCMRRRALCRPTGLPLLLGRARLRLVPRHECMHGCRSERQLPRLTVAASIRAPRRVHCGHGARRCSAGSQVMRHTEAAVCGALPWTPASRSLLARQRLQIDICACTIKWLVTTTAKPIIAPPAASSPPAAAAAAAAAVRPTWPPPAWAPSRCPAAPASVGSAVAPSYMKREGMICACKRACAHRSRWRRIQLGQVVLPRDKERRQEFRIRRPVASKLLAANAVNAGACDTRTMHAAHPYRTYASPSWRCTGVSLVRWARRILR